MIRNLYHKPRIDWLLVFMLAWLLVILLSCNVIKGKRSTRSQTDSVSRQTTATVDTSQGGSVSKDVSRETFDWSKLTLQYPPGDTNITNIYNYPQRPATVIYETGKGTKEESRTDSAWFHNFLTKMDERYDARFTMLEESIKNKETKPNIWFYVIFGAIILAAQGVLKLAWGWIKPRIPLFNNKSKQ